MMEKKKKGFTLVELLAALAIMGIVVTMSFYSYASYTKKNKEKILRIEAEQLEVAARAYLKEIELDENYKFHTIKNFNGEEIVKSCISIRKLQEMGYYKGDVDFTSGAYENAVVKVTKVNGVTNYEVVTNYNAATDKNGDRHCYHFVSSDGGISDTDLSVTDKKDKDSITVDTTITPNGDGTYKLGMKMLADVFDKVIDYQEIMPDVYLTIVLDASGSMSYTRTTDGTNRWLWDAARSAIVDMVDSLSSSSSFGSHLKTEIIRFESGAQKLKSFSETKTITTSFFGSVGGGTFIADGLSMAWDGIKGINSKYKYVIALSDGDASGENCSTYYTISYPCSTDANTIAKAAALLKNNTEFIVIGYGKSTSLKRYETEADQYFDQVIDIDTVFGGITADIIEEVQKQSMSRAEIVVEFSDYIVAYDQNGERTSKLVIPVSFDKGSIKASIVDKMYSYKIELLDSKLTDDMFTCGTTSCSLKTPLSLFSNYYLQVYDMEGKPTTPLSLGASPTINVERQLMEFINK